MPRKPGRKHQGAAFVRQMKIDGPLAGLAPAGASDIRQRLVGHTQSFLNVVVGRLADMAEYQSGTHEIQRAAQVAGLVRPGREGCSLAASTAGVGSARSTAWAFASASADCSRSVAGTMTSSAGPPSSSISKAGASW